uniref:Integrase catalytic domain-containing protein n=1 Tax=Lactuca sativa TaxID=4236 RepID=A0A9R1VG45_LACSA|nr:hypothetical protein LSAT_V11C500295510 [Lactuca sativa]
MTAMMIGWWTPTLMNTSLMKSISSKIKPKITSKTLSLFLTNRLYPLKEKENTPCQSLTKDLQCDITFFPDFCIYTRSLIGAGECRKGLYWMRVIGRERKAMMTILDTWHKRLMFRSINLVILVPRPNILGFLFQVVKLKVEIVLICYIGTYRFPSFSRASYSLTITDDFCRSVLAFMLKLKHESSKHVVNFHKLVKNQFGKCVKRIRCDNGGEFTSNDMLKFYNEQGILLETSCPQTPQQNGVVDNKSPYEIIFEQKPDYDKYRDKGDKFEMRGRTEIFLVVYRDVRFCEDIFPFRKMNTDPNRLSQGFLSSYRLQRRAKKKFHQAIKDERWKEVMKREIRALEENGTWTLEKLPEGKCVIDSKWVYKVKYKPNDDVEWYKARLVTPLLQLPIKRYWSIQQLDVNNAFLHKDLNKEVYMKLPQGFAKEGETRFCRLRKSYNLKKALRKWYQNFTNALLELGFSQSKVDHSLFFIIDIKVACTSECLVLSQRKYILDILANCGLEGCRPSSFPIEHKLKLTKGEDEPQVDAIQYRQIVGRLLYLQATKLDIAYTINILSQIVANPRQSHLNVAHSILRYLKNTLGLYERVQLRKKKLRMGESFSANHFFLPQKPPTYRRKWEMNAHLSLFINE